MQESSNGIPFGLLELDAADTVIFYDPARECADCATMGSLIGRNLFTDILVLPKLNDLQRIVNDFRQGGLQFKSFRYSFTAGTKVEVVTILIAHKPNHDPSNRITLLQIIDSSGER